MGAPSTHNMFGLSMVGHVHWSSHYWIVLSCGLEFWLHAFMSV